MAMLGITNIVDRQPTRKLTQISYLDALAISLQKLTY
jgi:hypothetical protein